MDRKRKRAAMKPVSEAARVWAEALRQEVETWPRVATKAAFGMTLVYRNSVVFAALPRTRALYEQDAILLKFNSLGAGVAARITADSCFAGTMEQRHKPKSGGEGARWHVFLVREDADVHRAVEWLGEAYEAAKKTRARENNLSND